MQPFYVLGCRVDGFGRDAALARVIELAHGSAPSLVVTLGTEMVMAARGNARFRAAVDRAALALCDTIGLLLVSRLRSGPLTERVTGVELVERLAASGDAGVRLYLLGGAPGVAETAAAVLRARYPTASIAGVRDGYFSARETAAVCESVARSGANVLLAGLGSPKQELWLDDHLAATGCTVGIGVGGSFDIISGKLKRAPQLVRSAGFEWLYRLVREPRRWRRQLALPRFAVLALGETAGFLLSGRRHTV